MVRRQIEPRRIAAWAALGLFAAAVLVFYLWHLNENIRLGWDMARLESEMASARKQVESLEARRARLLAPDRVERIAKSELKMGEPRPDQIVYEEP